MWVCYGLPLTVSLLAIPRKYPAADQYLRPFWLFREEKRQRKASKTGSPVQTSAHNGTGGVARMRFFIRCDSLPSRDVLLGP
jgi:hypothetical protein